MDIGRHIGGAMLRCILGSAKSIFTSHLFSPRRILHLNKSLLMPGLLMAGVSFVPLHAQTMAYNVPAGTVGNRGAGGTSVGDDFEVISPVTISQLGVFDSGTNGIMGGATLTVQLYERSGDGGGSLLETMTFDAASPGRLVGGTLFKPLARPVTLLPGNYTIAAYGFDKNNPAGNVGFPPYGTNNPPPWTMNDGGGLIRFVGLGRFGKSGSYPGHFSAGPADRYAAGNFMFSAATLPSPPYAADYAALIAGVSAFPIEDIAHMGSIAVVNPGAFPVLVEHGGNRQVMEAAGTYNDEPNGSRAVVFAHTQWEYSYNDARVRLFENAIQWAARKGNPSDIVLGIATNVVAGYMPNIDPGYFIRRGYQVVPLDFSAMDPAAGLPAMDVLVLDGGHVAYDEAWARQIEKFNAAGGGLVIGMIPYFQLHTEVRPAFNYANEILAPYGMAYRNSLDTPPVETGKLYPPPVLQSVPYPVYFIAFPAAAMLYEDRIGQMQLDSQQKAVALNTIAYASLGNPELLSELTAVYSGTTNSAIEYPGNAGDMVNVVTMTGSQASNNQLGNWAVDGTDLVAKGRRGLVEFDFNLPAPDMYQLQINGAQDLQYNTGNDFPLVLTLDGVNLGQFDLDAGTAGGMLQCLTPYLTAGPHTLRILWENPASYTELRLKSLVVQTRLGADSNGNGIKDWVDQMLQAESGLDNTNALISSYTSPVCLEGRDPYLPLMGVSVQGADNKTASLSPLPSPDQRWYVNVPLSAYANAQTLLNVTYQNGGLSDVRNLEWLPLNLLTAGNVTIRQGDSLLFNAMPANAPAGMLSITVGTNQLAGRTTQPIACKFARPGTFAVTGTYSPTNGTPQSGTINVKVVGQSFSNNPDCWVGREREWDMATPPSRAVLDADARLFFSEGPAIGGNQEATTLITDQNRPRYIVSRLGTNGPVLDSAQVRGFQLWSGNNTYAKILQTYPDGSQLIESLLILSPVLPDLTVRLDVIVGGVTFDDGTTSRILTAADFDSMGQYLVHFIRPAGSTTSVCHSISVFQGSTLIYYTR